MSFAVPRRCPSVQSCQEPSRRFPNLFVNERSIQKLSRTRQFQETFAVKEVRQRFPLSGTCNSMEDAYSTRQQKLPTCDQPEYLLKEQRQRQRQGERQGQERARNGLRKAPCCETKLTITIPETVTSLFNGLEWTVVHLPSSYQLLHEGQCAEPNAICATGRCQVAYRVQWLLVEQGSRQTFVPVSVGNHCYCRGFQWWPVHNDAIRASHKNVLK